MKNLEETVIWNFQKGTEITTPQQRLEEIAKQELALADEKAKLLAASKDADLETVKKLGVGWLPSTGQLKFWNAYTQDNGTSVRCRLKRHSQGVCPTCCFALVTDTSRTVWWEHLGGWCGIVAFCWIVRDKRERSTACDTPTPRWRCLRVVQTYIPFQNRWEIVQQWLSVTTQNSLRLWRRIGWLDVGVYSYFEICMMSNKSERKYDGKKSK